MKAGSKMPTRKKKEESKNKYFIPCIRSTFFIRGSEESPSLKLNNHLSSMKKMNRPLLEGAFRTRHHFCPLYTASFLSCP